MKKILNLKFKHIAMREGVNLNREIPADARRGIYMYVFSDGTRYVGKSINMASRYAQHAHEYEKDSDFREKGITVTDVYFAPLANQSATDVELDEMETKAIAWAEKSYDLRNYAKTGRPGGEGDLEVVISDQASVLLPWDRRDMTQGVVEEIALESSVKTAKARFDRLRKFREYDAAADVVSSYIAKTIPEAAACANVLWTVTALPNTGAAGYKRAMTLTCGTIETLVILIDEEANELFGFVNVKRPEGDSDIKPNNLPEVGLVYDAADGVVNYEFNNLNQLAAVLEDDRFLDWCYRLNIELMRKGGCPCGMYGNIYLEADLLSRL